LQRSRGVTNELLLAIVADRLAGFQRGPFASNFNADALIHIDEAMKCLKQRTQLRLLHGTEGKHMPDLQGQQIERVRIVNDILMIDFGRTGFNTPLELLRTKWAAWGNLERVLKNLDTPLTAEEWKLIETIPIDAGGINGMTEMKQALAKTRYTRRDQSPCQAPKQD
jgi:hypothetical protein